jgi:hypothetical protein
MLTHIHAHKHNIQHEIQNAPGHADVTVKSTFK